MSVGLAVLATFLLGFAAATQQRAARAQPPHRPLSPHLVLALLRDRWWLVAVGLMVAGYGAQAAALGEGQLAVVEPILSGYLVVALVVASARSRRRVEIPELAAALAVSAGIALFLTEVRPSPGAAAGPGEGWLLVLAGLAALLVATAPALGRSSGANRALLLGAVGGLALGVSDGLTKQTISIVAERHLQAVGDWAPYALVAVGVTAFLLQQSAYHAGPLASALPPLSVAEPLSGTLLGLALFRESAAPTMSPVLVGAALLLIAWGIQRLARSELIAGRAPLEPTLLA